MNTSRGGSGTRAWRETERVFRRARIRIMPAALILIPVRAGVSAPTTGAKHGTYDSETSSSPVVLSILAADRSQTATSPWPCTPGPLTPRLKWRRAGLTQPRAWITRTTPCSSGLPGPDRRRALAARARSAFVCGLHVRTRRGAREAFRASLRH